MKNLAHRARMLQETRHFFSSRSYLEVETPEIVPSPGLDIFLDAFALATPGAERFLSTSPEYQMKRLLADGHPRLFQICRAFRRDECGERHNPEFSILEFYRAPGSLDEILADTEQLVARLTRGLVTVGDKAISTLPPFRRLTVKDAFQIYAKMDEQEMLDCAAGDETRFFHALAFEVEPALAELNHAVFLTEYPTVFASLARKCKHNEQYAERAELYIAGVELCNAFGELVDEGEQRDRFLRDQNERRKLGKSVYPIDEQFLAALKRGIPQAAGNAIGFDRLAALAAGQTSINEVMAFTANEL